MPDEMRNSDRWKSLLPAAAGTGRNPEQENARLQLILKWMDEQVLPTVQPVADAGGFGDAWREMCEPAADATKAVRASKAAWAVDAGAADAVDATKAAEAARYAGAARATWAAKAAWDAEHRQAWDDFNPCLLLRWLTSDRDRQVR